MSVLAATTGSTASGKATSSASSAPTTSHESQPVPGRVAILRILDRVLVLFVLLAMNGTPLFNLAFERGIQ
jgi:hypothetical protein